MWDLKPGLDLRRFPSSGPYKLDSVTVTTARSCWWPTTAGGVPNRSPGASRCGRATPTSRTAHRRSFDVVDVATGSSGTLTVPDDYIRTEEPVGGRRAAHLRRCRPAVGATGAPCPWRSARRANRSPATPGADRQLAAQSRQRGRVRCRRERSRRPASSRVRPGRRPRGVSGTAADRPNRLPVAERPARRDGRSNREGLRSGGHRRSGGRLRDHRAAGVAGQRD